MFDGNTRAGNGLFFPASLSHPFLRQGGPAAAISSKSYRFKHPNLFDCINPYLYRSLTFPGTHHKMQAVSKPTMHSHPPGRHGNLKWVGDSSSLSPRCSHTARWAHPAAQASPDTSSHQPFTPLPNHQRKRRSCQSSPRPLAGSLVLHLDHARSHGPSLASCPPHHR